MSKKSKISLLAEEYLQLVEYCGDNGVFTEEEREAALTEYRYIIKTLDIDAEIYAEVFKLVNGPHKGATQFQNVTEILKKHGYKFNIIDILYWIDEIEFILPPEDWRVCAACIDYILHYCDTSALPIRHRA